MKELLRYIKGYKKETILAPLFKLLEASFELFVPLVMASIIDNGIIQKKYNAGMAYGTGADTVGHDRTGGSSDSPVLCS